MRKRLLVLLLSFVMSFAFVTGLLACAEEETPPASTAYSYSLGTQSMTLKPGDTQKLTVTVSPEKEISPSFESGDTAIATVADDGTVTAVAVGDTAITVTVDGKTLTCSVKVQEQGGEEQPEYTLTPATFSLTEGEERRLTLLVDPEQTVTPTFESQDTAIATVTGSGMTATVTAVAVGTTSIYAKIDGETVATSTVTVKAKAVEYEYSLSETTLALSLGETETLSVTVTPDKSPLTVVWESSDETKVTVADDGTVKAVAAGTANVTAKVDGNTLTCAVTVTSPVTVGTVTTEDVGGAEVFLDEHGTLFWERYYKPDNNGDVLSEKSAGNDKYIPAATNGAFLQPNGFSDYAAVMLWRKETAGVKKLYAGASGIHSRGGSAGTVSTKIVIDGDVTAVKLLTGAWRSTNTTALYLNGVEIASADTFSAGETSVARLVTFPVALASGETLELEVRITCSEPGEGGNCSLIAYMIKGEDYDPSTEDPEFEYTAQPVIADEFPVNGAVKNDPDLRCFNLTEIGTQDWYYLNFDGLPDRKNVPETDRKVLENTLDFNNGGSGQNFWDYRAGFKWSDGVGHAGTKNDKTNPGPGNPQDNDNAGKGTNNGVAANSIGLSVKADRYTTKITLFVTGYKSTYYIALTDTKGAVLNKIKVKDRAADSVATYVEYPVDVQSETVFNFYMYCAGNNCGLAAVAVSGYDYTLTPATAEIKDNETKQLTLARTDGEAFTGAVWSSSDENIATVDQSGLVTAVAVGTVTVTVNVDGKTLTSALTVISSAITYDYAISDTAKELNAGETVTLVVTITPAPAVPPAITFVSSAPAVASVDATGKVTGLNAGTAEITAEIEGVTLTTPLKCAVTVTSPLAASVEVLATDGNAFDLDYEGNVYWEHYYYDGKVKADKKTGGDGSYIPEAKNGILAFANGCSFDKANFAWYDGSYSHTSNSSVHSTPNKSYDVDIAIKIDANVKKIHFFYGAWKSTSTVMLMYNGVAIATASPVTAGDASSRQQAVFTVDFTGSEPVEVTLRVNIQAAGGNCQMPTIALEGAHASVSATTAVEVNIGETYDWANKTKIDLTAVGDLDWWYLYDNVRKTGGTTIDAASFHSQNRLTFTDYKAQFTWSDGATDATPKEDTDDGVEAGYTNNGVNGVTLSLNVNITKHVTNVYFYVGGYDSVYYMTLLDGKGNCLYNGKVKDKIAGNTAACCIDVAVTATADDVLTMYLYKQGNNVALPAVAVKGHKYTLAPAEFEIEPAATQQLTAAVMPADPAVTIEYSSSDAAIATVNETGLVTGVANGTATITVTFKKDGALIETATCTVTVDATDYVYSLSETAKTVILGNTYQPQVVISPKTPAVLPAYTWASDNTAVATVSADGEVSAVGVGSANITLQVDGESGVLTVAVTVTSPVSATASALTDATGNITLNNVDETLGTMYWEHYMNGFAVTPRDVENIYTSNNTLMANGNKRNVEDYKAHFVYYNGTRIRVSDETTKTSNYGMYTNDTFEFDLAVSPKVKGIRLYAGAWRATNTASVWYNGVKLAEAAGISAGDSSVNQYMTMMLNVTDNATVKVKFTVTGAHGGGNISLEAIAVLGDKADAIVIPAATTTVTIGDSGKHLFEGGYDQTSNQQNLTEYGDIDWYYSNYDNKTDEKKDGTAIIADSLAYYDITSQWDSNVAFKWTDGTKWGTSPIDRTEANKNECDTGTNNYKYGTILSIDVNVDETTGKVYFWIGAYESDINVAVTDSKGNSLLMQKIEEKAGGGRSYRIEFDINATAADRLTFTVYKSNGMNSIRFSAIAVAAKTAPSA